MTSDRNAGSDFPAPVAAIERCGYATFKGDGVTNEFRAMFDTGRVPVVGIRHVRMWGIQVDDERALPGHERTSIPDEELWQVRLQARDGSVYEVNADLLSAASD